MPGLACKSEQHKRQTNVTEHTLEDGSMVSDHAILEPIRLSLEYHGPNMFTVDETLPARFQRQTQYQTISAYDTLNEIWRQREPFSIVTEHEVYDNMLIESLTELHEAPNRGAVNFSIELKQINYATIQRGSVPESQLADGVNKSGATQVETGAGQPIPLTTQSSTIQGRAFQALTGQSLTNTTNILSLPQTQTFEFANAVQRATHSAVQQAVRGVA